MRGTADCVPGEYTVVSHDAGGAEVLSSYLRRSGARCRFVLEGPARRVFERKLGPLETLGLEDALAARGIVLCGSSWQSELEFDALGMARERGLRCITFLDHWVNYAERFTRAGVVNLPDEIWVGDDIAQQIAARTFPDMRICEVQNPYLLDIAEELARMPLRRDDSSLGISLLYICEPIGDRKSVV